MRFFPPEPRDLSVGDWIADAPLFGPVTDTRTVDDRKSVPLASPSGHDAPARRAGVADGTCRADYLIRP